MNATDTTQTGTGTEPESPPAADFDGSGQVDFTDFFLFVDAFGKEEPRFDLDSSGQVDFTDFFLFVDAFGRPTGGD